ncbi:MAG: mannitol-1-phosphate 5-dehydrogenase, partial [Leptotrichiaceae bacterium]|nr:mannitol-1-phosphate 5-dehydrogenase [Leptotrichiaceae bacterium]MBP6167282.1 mannitol-1-phosphate 5-dehydrogenase [Leptotrichiaceae bacterium]MBP9538300.1 mannitol-1-phosphate 5-dehydrogenase [Leptotrichiaceae bacterium]
MEALHFGAGNIGRGFIGKLLSEAGYRVNFVDINEAVIKSLEANGEYIVEVVGETATKEVVKNVNGIFSTDTDAILKVGNETGIITMAVGPNVLPIIAKTVAKIIKNRKELNNTNFLNVIACENMIKGSSFLKEKVLAELSEEEAKYVDSYVAFVDSAVDRIVPPTDSGITDPTYVMVEEFYEWIVDKNQIKGNLEIKGMIKVDNLMAYLERKLFTLNTGHAITAYIGKSKGIATVDESIMDPEVRAIVVGAMKESGEVLINRYSFVREEHYKYIEKILKRFENKYLKDDVSRVGRQPIRKLGKNERLIKPLLGTIEYNLPNDNLLQGIIYALKFDGEDEESIKLKGMLKEKGVEA